MKYLRQLPFILIFTFLSGCIAVNADLPEIKSVTTDKGHDVYYIPLETETVTIHAAFKNDYIFTEGANPVVPHIGLQLIQQAGAGDIEPATLLSEFEDLGADAQLHARPDAIHGKLVADVADIEAAAKLANQVLTDSTLDERWFRRVAGNLVEKAGLDRNHSGVLGWSAMRKLSFDPMVARFWSASFADTQAVELDQVKDWYQQSFNAGDAIIVLSGPKDMASGLRAVDILLDQLDQKQPRAVTVEQEPFVPVAKTILIENSAANDALVLLFDHVKGEARRREFETYFTAYELGATSESRLHRKLRDELRAAYEVFTQFADFDRQVRLLAMGGQVSPDQAVAALRLASETYDNYREQGMDQSGFDQVKKVYVDHFEDILNEDSLPPNLVLEALLEGHEVEFVNSLLPTVRGMNLMTHNEFSAAHLSPSDQLLRIIVAPDIDAIELDVDCRVKQPEQLAECV
ncbi:insulinase family protein [Maritalea mediterranea]|uniref:Insulinase family protein n=1 Tax=Maritalea mediterranea TaxID=2909667 RepID=A0ABS9E491_9HYPH|nr:insulinase family protein [Maritalea mediterranea]MCF4097684.1 insulinase family protein [Maritalea mediterranea]